MAVVVTRNFAKLDTIQLTTREDMRDVGLLAREAIWRRTRRGQGTDGPFPPYSPGYAKAKQQAGADGGTVNLTLSGGMLNAITVTVVDEQTVELGFDW